MRTHRDYNDELPMCTIGPSEVKVSRTVSEIKFQYCEIKELNFKWKVSNIYAIFYPLHFLEEGGLQPLLNFSVLLGPLMDNESEKGL